MANILVIDDVADNLVSLQALIFDYFSGFDVFTATSGPEGIELAKSHPPDVILLDILMPGMDGFDVCTILKEEKTLCDIPVVFITALKENSANKVRALEVGADGFLSKPVDENELCAQIKAMLKIKAANDSRKSEKQRLATLVSERTKNLVEELRLNREMSKKLRQSEERFRVVQEISPDGFTILHPVRNEKGEVLDFTWVYENQAVARINGTDPEDVIGKRLLDLFPSHRETPVFETYLYVANTGKTRVLEEIYMEKIVSRPIWLRLVVVSMGDDIAILNQDITGHKLAEDKLAEQLHELQRLHGVMLDREDRIIELKREVNALLNQAGQPTRYPSAVEM